MDDEDKGSPSRRWSQSRCFPAVELQRKQREKIDRSAEALRVRHHPVHLSLRIEILQQYRASNQAGKDAGSGKYQHVIASAESAWQSYGIRRLLRRSERSSQ